MSFGALRKPHEEGGISALAEGIEVTDGLFAEDFLFVVEDGDKPHGAINGVGQPTGEVFEDEVTIRPAAIRGLAADEAVFFSWVVLVFEVAVSVRIVRIVGVQIGGGGHPLGEFFLEAGQVGGGIDPKACHGEDSGITGVLFGIVEGEGEQGEIVDLSGRMKAEGVRGGFADTPIFVAQHLLEPSCGESAHATEQGGDGDPFGLGGLEKARLVVLERLLGEGGAFFPEGVLLLWGCLEPLRKPSLYAARLAILPEEEGREEEKAKQKRPSEG